MAKKVYDDDDGRVIADMSGVESPYRFRRSPKPPARSQEPQDEARPDRPWESAKDAMSRQDRRLYILGALKAALLIGFAYIAGLGLLIWLLVSVLT